MNIRKHWKRLLLTTTALFWTSCTSENDSALPTIAQDTSSAVDPSASSNSNTESSSENTVESSSSDAVASSSSEAKAPSSSSTVSRPYKLAGDTTVACALNFRNGKCLYPIKRTLEELKDSLENNKTLPLSELEYFEDELEEYELEDDLGPQTMYGPLAFFIDQDNCWEYVPCTTDGDRALSSSRLSPRKEPYRLLSSTEHPLRYGHQARTACHRKVRGRTDC